MNPTAELRALAALLATRDVSADMLDDVSARLAVILAELDAQPERPRWYDGDPDDRGASRAYHDEFGPLRGWGNVIAPPLVFGESVLREGRPVVAAHARCGVLYEGPPRLVHGGIVAACFDEVLAVAQRDAGVNGLTRELTVRYRRPIRIETDLVFTGWIERDDGQRAVGRAACHVEHELCADATAEFVRLRR